MKSDQTRKETIAWKETNKNQKKKDYLDRHQTLLRSPQ